MKKYFIFAALLLTACGMTQQSRFYRLQPAAAETSVSGRKLNIGVEEVSVPKYIDRPQMVVTEAGSSELKVSEFNRWAEPLTASFTRVLADDISLYLPNALVKPKSYASEEFTYTVIVEINKFDAVMDGQVTLDAWWTIYKNGNVAARGRTVVSGEAGKGFDGIVEEQSRLVNEAARQIAGRIAKL